VVRAEHHALEVRLKALDAVRVDVLGADILALSEQRANLVQHEPSGLLGHLNVTGQLKRRYALLVAADEIHRQEPLAQRQLGVLEDGARDAGEVVATDLATEAAIRATGAMVLAAVWANNIVAPTCFSQCLLTSLFVNEVVGYCDEGVELCEIYHGKRCV